MKIGFLASHHGAILAQSHVPVYQGDTVATLAQRVLAREHSFSVETLQHIMVGNLVLPKNTRAV